MLQESLETRPLAKRKRIFDPANGLEIHDFMGESLRQNVKIRQEAFARIAEEIESFRRDYRNQFREWARLLLGDRNLKTLKENFGDIWASRVRDLENMYEEAEKALKEGRKRLTYARDLEGPRLMTITSKTLSMRQLISKLPPIS